MATGGEHETQGGCRYSDGWSQAPMGPLFCVVTAQFPRSGHSQAELKRLIALKAGDLGGWESGEDFLPVIPW